MIDFHASTTTEDIFFAADPSAEWVIEPYQKYNWIFWHHRNVISVIWFLSSV